jgi:hypothetical protein
VRDSRRDIGGGVAVFIVLSSCIGLYFSTGKLVNVPYDCLHGEEVEDTRIGTERERKNGKYEDHVEGSGWKRRASRTQYNRIQVFQFHHSVYQRPRPLIHLISGIDRPTAIVDPFVQQ